MEMGVVGGHLSGSIDHETNLIEFGTLGRLRNNAVDLRLFG